MTEHKFYVQKAGRASDTACSDRPKVLQRNETMKPVGLRLRFLNFLLRISGNTRIEDMDNDQIIAGQRSLKRNAVVDLIFGSLASEVEVREVTIQLQTHELLLRVYECKEKVIHKRQAILYMHGGGWVSGNAGMTDWWCSEIARRADSVVISVNYRLAPRHPYPAALHDCHAALRWLHENSAFLGVDPNMIGVAGDSAGANLAASLCLYAIQENGPKIESQTLIYPSLDLTLSSPSVTEQPHAPFLTYSAALTYIDHYLGAEGSRLDPLISPLMATYLNGLPRTLIQVAQHDPLRDDGWRYSQRLINEGIAVRITEYAGAPHGFISFPGLTPIAEEALLEASVFIGCGRNMFSDLR